MIYGLECGLVLPPNWSAPRASHSFTVLGVPAVLVTRLGPRRRAVMKAGKLKTRI